MSFVLAGALAAVLGAGPARSGGPPSIHAAAAAEVRLDVQLGLGGWVVPGRLAPMRVEVSAEREVRGALEVEVRGAAGEVTTYVREVQVPPGGRQHLSLDVLITDPRREITARLQAGPLQAQQVLRPGTARAVEGIVVAVTAEPAGLEFLAAAGGRRRPAYLAAHLLPSGWQGYDAVDLVALRDVEPRALLPDQVEALVGWVARGGRLVVAPGEGTVLPAELDRIAPAHVLPGVVAVPGLPVPVRPLALRTGGAVVSAQSGRALAVRGRFGRGVVEVWAVDPFGPAGRAWPGRLRLWRSLLALPPAQPVAGADLASELPRTRPLSGRTQLAFALLGAAYVAAVRLLLPRVAPVRGGWIVVAAAVAVFSLLLYGSAAGARRAAGSIAQISIVEALPGTGRARAATLAALITPYGGTVRLRLPPDAAVRPLGPGRLRVDAAGVRTGGGRGGQVEVEQIVALDLRAAIERYGDRTEVVTAGPPASLAGAVLYRSRQMYRLPQPLPQRAPLDPVRWERAQPTALGGDLAARALEWLFARLDRAGGEAGLWLVGRLSDPRIGVRLPDGGAGEAAQLVVAPVEVR